MIKLSVISVLFLAFLLPVIQSCQTSKSSTTSKMLRLNFEKGKSYDYEMISDIDQEVGGKKNEISMNAQYGLDVIDIKDGILDITSTFNSMRLSVKMEGMTLEVDTEKPLVSDTGKSKNPLAMMSRMFQVIKGQKFHMKVSPEGKVLEVTGLDEMFRNMMNSLDIPEEMKTRAETSFKQQFSDTSLRDQFERAFFIFPGKEVKVGDSWEKTQAGMVGMGEFKTKYTVEEIEGDMVTLDVKSKLSGTRPGGDAQIEGTQDGSMVVDSRTGLIMESDLALDFVAGDKENKLKMVGRMKMRGRERR